MRFVFISDELFNCLINEKHFIKGTKVINLRVSRLKVHVNLIKIKENSHLKFQKALMTHFINISGYIMTIFSCLKLTAKCLRHSYCLKHDQILSINYKYTWVLPDKTVIIVNFDNPSRHPNKGTEKWSIPHKMKCCWGKCVISKNTWKWKDQIFIFFKPFWNTNILFTPIATLLDVFMGGGVQFLSISDRTHHKCF